MTSRTGHIAALRRAWAAFFFAEESVARVQRFRALLAVWTAALVVARLPYVDELYALPVLREGPSRWLSLGAPPLALVDATALALLVALACLLAGVRPRASQAATLVSFAALTAFEVRMPRAYVELALVQWLLLQFAPPGPRRGAPAGSGPRWATRLVMLQFTAVYVFAGLGKLAQPAWRSGDALARIVGAPHTGAFLLSDWLPLGRGAAPLVLAWLTIVGELGIGLGLWHRRTRRAAMLAAVVLHLGMALTLRISPLFHALMLAHLVLFAAPPGARCAPHNEAGG